MDHLYPKLTPYEFDYTTDINKKMRVPEKLSYDSDNSGTLSEGHDVSFRNYPVADITHASSQVNQDEASASANAHAGVVCETSCHRSKERLRLAKPSSQSSVDQQYLSTVEQNLVKLEERISHLEFQQAIFKGGLTLYILYRIMRWIIRNA
ncbi:unnamed protein product [Trichobilharzia regenti]|nr:unnamed protein product [Trichobilharzia regenti]